MRYTLEDLHAGMKLRCTDDKEFSHWTTGKIYELKEDPAGHMYIRDDNGEKVCGISILGRLNGNTGSAEFEVVAKVIKDTDYTEEDLEEGMLFHCKDDMSFPWWATGQTYEIYKGEKGILFTKSGDGNQYCAKEIVARLNGSASGSFELLERPHKAELEKKVEARIKELEKEKRRLLDKQQQLKVEENEVSVEISKLREALKAIDILREFE